MQKNKGILVLRGVFIIMIVIHHLDLFIGGGSLGVSFFFILGGFALSLGYYDKVNHSDFIYSEFIKKRCGKFFPLHWLCLLASIPLVTISIIQGSATIKAALISFIPNAICLQSLVPFDAIYFSYNAVSWYLSTTLVLTLTYPFIVRSLNQYSNLGKANIALTVFICYAILVIMLPKNLRHSILYINPIVRVVDFIIGIYLYLFYKNYQHKVTKSNSLQKIFQIVGILALAVSILISQLIPRDVRMIAAVYWLPLSILLLSYVFQPKIKGWGYNIIAWIGDISFPIFLTHWIIIRYANTICNIIGLDNKPLKVVVTIPLIILVAWLCDKYFLKQVLLWSRGRKN